MVDTNNYSEPGVRDYDNLWDPVISPTHWTVTGTVAKGKGAIYFLERNGVESISTAIDLKNFPKFNFSITASVHVRYSSGSGSGYIYVRLVCGANSALLFEGHANALAGNNYMNSAAGCGAFFSITNRGSDILIQRSGVTWTNAMYASPHAILIADNSTLTLTSSPLVLQITTTGTGAVTHKWSCLLSAFQIVSKFLGSRGTQ